MPRAIPWILTTIFLLGFIGSFSELQRMRARFGEVTRHQFHDHAEVRQFMIQAALADVTQPIVVIGDSITEMAPLPREICGHAVVNAGVGGQTISEAKRLASRVLDEHGAYLIALTVGANDAGSPTAQSDFSELIDAVKPLSARPLVAAAVSSDAQTNRAIATAAAAHGVPFVTTQIPAGSKMADGIHYTRAAYKVWVPTLVAAVAKLCG